MAGAADCCLFRSSFHGKQHPSLALLWGGKRGGFPRGQTSPIGSVRPAENSSSYPTQVERPQFQGWEHPWHKTVFCLPEHILFFRELQFALR